MLRRLRLLGITILIGMFAACGPTAREKAITATYVTLTAADKAYLAYDKQHEAELITKAAPGQAEAAVTNYHAQRVAVDKARAVAWQALLAAAIANDDPSVQGALAAIKALDDLFKTLGVAP